MKKIVNVLLIVIVAFLGIRNVDAMSTDKNVAYNKTTTNNVDIPGLYTGSQAYEINWYTLSSYEGSYPSYCLDPHKRPADTYTVNRFLGETDNPQIDAADYGMLEIMKLGYNQFNNSYTYSVETPESNGELYTVTLTGEDLYAATSIAIRAYILGLFVWGGDASDNNFMRTQGSAHANVGASWASFYPTMANAVSGLSCPTTGDGITTCFSNSVKSNYGWYRSNIRFIWDGYGTRSYRVIYGAQQLFLAGLQAGYESMQEGFADSSVTAAQVSVVQDGTRTDNQVQEFIYANVNITDFSENAYINNFQFTCNGCSSAGITYDYMEYYTADNEWKRIETNTDISQEITPDESGLRSGTVRIRIHITKNISEDECQNATYTVTFDYYDSNKEYIGALLKNNNSADKQRLIIIDKASSSSVGNNKGSFTGTITCVNPVCDTEISIPICSDDENEAISEITAPEDIKKCILDNVDDAGNSYQLSETNGGVDNAYCSVFCKEDYRDVIDDNKPGGIKLNPVVEDVECGSYFQLTSHIEGKKDCYTGGDGEGDSINREQFLVDIEEAQSAMVDAMNRYQEHYTKYLAAQNATEQGIGSCTCGGNSCGAMQRITVNWDTYDQWDFSFTNETASLNPTTGASGSESWEDSCNCDTGTSTGDEEPPEICGEPDGAAEDGLQAFSQEHEREYKQAEKDYKDAYERYVNAIKDYNGCTAAWTMEFPFAQRLKYYYNEYHGTEVFTSYYDLVQAANNEDLYYLDAVEDSLIEESEVVICKGETDDEYNCQSEALTFDDSIETEADEWNYVEAFGSAVYSDRTYVVCSDPDEGCVTETQKISDATFIRKTIKKSQDYITPTVYYQIEANGRVTVNSGYSGNAFKLDAIKNSLPVSTSLTGGGIYKLLLEDLGEFYDTGETGRLIDFGGENEEKSVAAAIGEEGIETFDGEYICNYQSTCQDPDCPDCDFVCDEDECYWGDRGSCPDCEFECINCIFNMGELQINFKPITTVDVTAADREYGYNWDVSTTLQALELLRDKADVAIEQIQNANDTIYDDTKGDDGSSSLAFSIRMTADVINYLKDYNKSVEDEGGYANDSLTCYDATIDGKTYANIFCYSDVIDDLYENYQDQITVGSGRLSRGERYERDDGTNNANSNGYWSLWDWTEPTRDANGQYSVIGGPSWR